MEPSHSSITNSALIQGWAAASDVPEPRQPDSLERDDVSRAEVSEVMDDKETMTD